MYSKARIGIIYIHVLDTRRLEYTEISSNTDVLASTQKEFFYLEKVFDVYRVHFNFKCLVKNSTAIIIHFKGSKYFSIKCIM